MAGKKGRSGRPRKKPVAFSVDTRRPAPAETGGKTESVEQTNGDPFGRIEAELKAAHPELNAPVDPAAQAAGVGAPPAPVQAPENLLRFLLQTLYKAEAAAGCVYLGLPLDHTEIFYEQNLVEAQVDPLCEVVKKHFPPDLLRDLNENSPEIMLGIRIFEAQLSFFGKLSKAKKEIAEDLAKKQTTATNPPPTQTPPPAAPKDNFSYPKVGTI